MLPEVYFLFSTVALLLHFSANVSHIIYNENVYRLSFSIVATLVISLRGLKRKSLDASGVFAALIVGFCVTYANLGFFASLMTVFLVGSKATKYGCSVKRTFEADHKEGEGQRNWVQVVSNAGIPTQLSVLFLLAEGPNELPIDFWTAHRSPASPFLALGVVAALSCCLGDTLASEIGSVSARGSPRLVTNMRVVPRGTNGAVSTQGILCSILGGFLVGLSYCVPGLLCGNTTLLTVAVTITSATCSGFFGSLLDSVLGATIQFSGLCEKTGKIVEVPGPDVKAITGFPICSNHSINLISVAATAILVPYLARCCLLLF